MAGYNGYSNWETWNVCLWMNNNEVSYRYWQEQARECTYVQELADRLEDWYSDHIPVTTGVYADLLNASLKEVDWYEIACETWDEAHENDSDEEEET